MIQHHELGHEGTIKYVGKNRPFFFEDGKLGGSYQFTDLKDNFIKVDFLEDQIELVESSTQVQLEKQLLNLQQETKKMQVARPTIAIEPYQNKTKPTEVNDSNQSSFRIEVT